MLKLQFANIGALSPVGLACWRILVHCYPWDLPAGGYWCTVTRGTCLLADMGALSPLGLACWRILVHCHPWDSPAVGYWCTVLLLVGLACCRIFVHCHPWDWPAGRYWCTVTRGTCLLADIGAASGEQLGQFLETREVVTKGLPLEYSFRCYHICT